MTVAYAMLVHRYIGLSTDVKPTLLIEVGSTFHETDTHYDYIWNGTAWVVCYWLGHSYPFETGWGY